jgi:hypothetical protein
VSGAGRDDGVVKEVEDLAVALAVGLDKDVSVDKGGAVVGVVDENGAVLGVDQVELANDPEGVPFG